MTRLLAFFAHPDDESYAVGGSLAAAARRGVDVMVVAATHGEAGHSYLETGDLAALRRRELECACRVLGARPPIVLDFPDGRLQSVRPELSRKALDLMESMRADVVLTLGCDGAYGHRDHLAVTFAVDAAVAAIDRPLRLAHAEFPRRLFVPVWRQLRRIQGVVEPSLGEQDFGVESEAVQVNVPIADTAGRKLEALACHRSQLPRAEVCNFLRPGLIDGMLGEEWFRIVAGPPAPKGCTDLFGGLG